MYKKSPQYDNARIIKKHKVIHVTQETKEHAQKMRFKVLHLVLKLFRDARNVTPHISLLDLLRVDLSGDDLPNRSAQ